MISTAKLGKWDYILYHQIHENAMNESGLVHAAVYFLIIPSSILIFLVHWIENCWLFIQKLCITEYGT